MKNKFILASLAASIISSSAFALEVKITDEKWDGQTVPEGQQCQKFGGQGPATPKLLVTEIPDDTDFLILEYSDRDSERMNNGGHGIMRYEVPPAATRIKVPSVPGHSYDMPDEFEMVSEHLGPKWDKAGAYMPPCSGGKGHAYYVTIKAMVEDTVLESTVVELGKF